MSAGARSAAKAAGLTRYVTGKPCKYGHISDRLVSNGTCMECFRAQRRGNPDLGRACSARYREKHPDRVRECLRKWRSENAEMVREYSKMRRSARIDQDRITRSTYRASNIEKIKATAAKWRIANRDKKRIHQQLRRARQKSADGIHTAGDIRRIYEMQNGRCGCCAKKVGDLYHIDHIVPLLLGGSNWPNNLQILCPSCNCKKRCSDPIDFMRSQGRLL